MRSALYPSIYFPAPTRNTQTYCIQLSMEAYKPAIVTNVESAIGAMNRVVSLLQQDKPLGSHIIEVNYRQETVQEFTKSSSDVVDVSPSRSLARLRHSPPRRSLEPPLRIRDICELA